MTKMADGAPTGKRPCFGHNSRSIPSLLMAAADSEAVVRVPIRTNALRLAKHSIRDDGMLDFLRTVRARPDFCSIRAAAP